MRQVLQKWAAGSALSLASYKARSSAVPPASKPTGGHHAGRRHLTRTNRRSNRQAARPCGLATPADRKLVSHTAMTSPAPMETPTTFRSLHLSSDFAHPRDDRQSVRNGHFLVGRVIRTISQLKLQFSLACPHPIRPVDELIQGHPKSAVDEKLVIRLRHHDIILLSEITDEILDRCRHYGLMRGRVR